jgi:hypothetical protein
VTEHPDDLLAEYVDGVLPPEVRAEVAAHVATCDRCRDEVTAAGRAREALASLPEEPAPEGLPLALRRARRAASPRAARWVAATAAAAVILLGGGFVVVRSFRTDGQAAFERAPAAGGDARRETETAGEPLEGGAQAEDAAALADRPALPTYTETDRDYEAAELVPLGRRIRDRARQRLTEGLAPTATVFFEDFDPEAFTPRVREAIECSFREIPPDQLLVPFSIEAASFQGEPAYVTTFLQGPRPEQPYDRVVMWVVARDGCTLRSLATQRL